MNAFRTTTALLFGVVLCLAVPGAAWAQTGKGGRATQPAGGTEPQPANIDRNGILMLVRSTILALDHANKTGNYTVLRDLGAPGFQANTAAMLADIFASNREQRLDLSGVAAIEPHLTIPPRIEPNGMLRMAGFFPSVPNRLDFDLLFAPVNRQWRLYGLSINVAPSGPVAPESEAAPEPEVSVELPDPPVPTFNPRRLEAAPD